MEKDNLLPDCIEYAKSQKTLSGAMLQEKFRLGYNRSGRIMDQLEAEGIISPFEGTKERRVLIQTNISNKEIVHTAFQNWLQAKWDNGGFPVDKSILNLYEEFQIEVVNRQLLSLGIKISRTKIGQAVFVPEETAQSFATKMLFPSDWSIAQLRAMADYMEVNPKCSLFEDGSGKPCK